jgi:CRP/FNR family transcriptional regulator, cyclic AMP receptor protein
MKTDQVAALLAQTAVFSELDSAALKDVASSSSYRSYRRGQYIVQQGDAGDRLFVIEDGRVKVVYTSEDGDELVLATMGPQEIFGELALLDGGPRSASVQALEPTTVYTVDRPSLIALMSRHSSVADALLRSLGRLVRRMIDQTGDLVFLDLHGRLAKLLVRLAEEQRPGESSVVELVRLTQSDLAAMVGGSRQSVNQVLKSFEDRQYLKVEGRKIVVRDLAGLRRRARLG